MRRIGMGMATGLAVWLGSAVMAEAQGPAITPTGPLSVVAGATTSTYTADVYLPVPCGYRVRLWIYNGINAVHMSETVVPNPGVSNTTFSKFANHAAPNAGDVFTYKAKIKVGTIWYDAADWAITISGTRPSTKPSYQKSKALALQSQATDRRREE